MILIPVHEHSKTPCHKVLSTEPGTQDVPNALAEAVISEKLAERHQLGVGCSVVLYPPSIALTFSLIMLRLTLTLVLCTLCSSETSEH